MGHYDNLYDQEDDSFLEQHKKKLAHEQKIEKQFKDRLGKLLNINLNDDDNMRIISQLLKQHE